MFSTTAVSRKDLTASVGTVFLVVSNNLLGAKVKCNHLKVLLSSFLFLLLIV